MKTLKRAGIVLVLCVLATVVFMTTDAYKASAFSTSQQGPLGGTSVTLPPLVMQPTGVGSTILANNILFGRDGYSFEASTTAGTNFSLTATQFCNLTSLHVPIANTTTVTVIFPSDAAVSAVCGTLTNGEWGESLIVNDSSFNLTLGTTSGSGITFQYEQGTPASYTQYPPQIQASTTAHFFPAQVETGSVTFNINQFSPVGNPKPTLNACGTGTVSATSTDVRGTITVTAGTPTSCQLTFSSRKSDTPTCIADGPTSALGAIGAGGNASTTGVLFGLPAAFVGSFSYICLQ